MLLLDTMNENVGTWDFYIALTDLFKEETCMKEITVMLPLEKRGHYTCVCRLAQPLNGGYKEIISRIRKHTNARTDAWQVGD